MLIIKTFGVFTGCDLQLRQNKPVSATHTESDHDAKEKILNGGVAPLRGAAKAAGSLNDFFAITNLRLRRPHSSMVYPAKIE
jgi:hypothetical protein